MTNQEILRVLKNARTYIQTEKYDFLCHAISASMGYPPETGCGIGEQSIKKIIPEFNRAFCLALYRRDIAWWVAYDKQSRLKALDKMILCYEQKIKEEQK